MTPERWERINAVLDALEDVPRTVRPGVLDEFCQGDKDLRLEVESLLEYEGAPSTLIDGSVLDLGATLAVDHGPEERVGPYRLLRLLGRGGMGEVYLARREEEYDQQVALKLIRPGFDMEDVLRRFGNERRILARLEHPNIARILDGGHTPEGRPYFVMEYVDGETLDRYCSRKQCTVRQRLELFDQVCDAVLASHRRLIIHRDLKPRNILVTAGGTVKLLDFGIAKVLEPSLEGYKETVLGRGLVFSVDYASPEQISGERIDTSTDIYSLGVLLCELLSGARPIDSTGKQYRDVVAAVCEQPPKLPSDLAKGAGQRRLAQELAGDLDAIVAKAVRKEPEARYQSVEELAEDLRRYRDGLPVRAVGDHRAYRIRKFLHRNRWPLAVGTLVVGLVLAAALVFVGLWREAKVQKQQADIARELAKHEAQEAQREADRSDVLLEEWIDLFEGNDRISPDDQGYWFNELGQLQQSRGNYRHAGELFRKALDLGDVLTPAQREIGSNNLAVTLMTSGHFEEAEAILTDLLRQRVQLDVSKKNRVMSTQATLGALYYAWGDLERAEAFQRDVLAWRLAQDDKAPGSVTLGALATIQHNLAKTLVAMGHTEEALDLAEEALATREKLEARDSAIGAAQATVAAALLDLGRYTEAELLLRQALEAISADKLALDWKTAEVQSLLGECLVRLGRTDEAEPHLVGSLRVLREARGEPSIYARDAARRVAMLEEITGKPVTITDSPDDLSGGRGPR